MVVVLRVLLLGSVCQLQSLRSVRALFWPQIDLEKIRRRYVLLLGTDNRFAFVVNALIFLTLCINYYTTLLSEGQDYNYCTPKGAGETDVYSLRKNHLYFLVIMREVRFR